METNDCPKCGKPLEFATKAIRDPGSGGFFKEFNCAACGANMDRTWVKGKPAHQKKGLEVFM